ncbi:hypothetical protein [Streptococcus hyointestinalis]|uniref:hypothetical protein n=1 Tax=Streptococcus hyointestinalis TaxID=1337 RepID=UPI0013DE87BB|nr:hypothetical protein [Streptococcus hyointestinalis]
MDSIVLYRLVQLHFDKSTFYHKKLTAATSYTVEMATQRGQIHDANGTALVCNVAKNVFTITRSSTKTTQYIEELAPHLPNYVTLDDAFVRTRDEKDY